MKRDTILKKWMHILTDLPKGQPDFSCGKEPEILGDRIREWENAIKDE